MNKAELLKELEDRGVEVPEGALKPELEALIEASEPVEVSTEAVEEEKEFFDRREVWKKEEVSVAGNTFIEYSFLDGTQTRELK